MTQRLEAEGASGGKKWDDGDDYEDVTKIYVRVGLHEGRFDGIQYIHFDYFKNGQSKYGSHHGLKGEGFTESKFEINHQNNEYLESVEGYYKIESNAIQALQFKTNFRTSEIMGYHHNYGTKFTLAVGRKKIIGFHGSSSSRNLNSLGAYFTWITPTKLESKGGKIGKEWDDGIDHENLTKIYVGIGHEGIQFIKFDYVKDGQPKSGEIHGDLGRGFTQVIEIDHNDNEYVISVEGFYDEKSKIIQGLQFKTNIKISEMMGYGKGKKFSLESYGKKIIGFHGSAEKNLNSLGAYVMKLAPIKLELHGGNIGYHWDDGALHGVKKIYVLRGFKGINCIRFEYDNAGKVENRQHGYIGGQESEFEVDYPNEFITSVEGTLIHDTDTWVKSLTFKTSKGRTSPTFGYNNDDNIPIDFVLENKGCALVGFHGRSTESGTFPDTVLIAIGAYFNPLPPPPLPPKAEKVEAQGGDGGYFWDDGGNFDGVSKIYIGHDEFGLAFVKFLYDKDARVIVGDDHGSKTLHGVEEFEIDYPNEYLISVEGSYGQIDGSHESEVLRMLKFKTNKRASQAFGLDTMSSFVLRKEGYKIVGFHGKANNMLHQIGVHILPLTGQY